MKKFYSILLAMMLAIGVLAACGETKTEDSKSPETSQAEKVSYPFTIKDAAGEEVVIEEKPEKLVSLMPSNTEIVYALGIGEELVGVTDYDTYPEEVADIEKVGGLEINIEKIISLNPDVVLAHASSAQSAGEGWQQLRDAGIDVVVVNDSTNFEDVYTSIEMIGQVTGETTEAAELVDSMKNKMTAIQEKAAKISDDDKKSVYIEVSGEPSIYTTGKNTFMQEMLNVINAENIIMEDGWIQVDQEAVISSNPDVIITTYGADVEGNTVDTISGREGWTDVTAVKDKQIIDVDDDIVTRSGPRIVEGVETIAKAVYPEVFN